MSDWGCVFSMFFEDFGLINYFGTLRWFFYFFGYYVWLSMLICFVWILNIIFFVIFGIIWFMYICLVYFFLIVWIEVSIDFYFIYKYLKNIKMFVYVGNGIVLW